VQLSVSGYDMLIENKFIKEFYLVMFHLTTPLFHPIKKPNIYP